MRHREHSDEASGNGSGTCSNEAIRALTLIVARQPLLIEQNTDTLLGLLAPLVARGINAGSQDWTTEQGSASEADQFGRLALLDMRLWWKADAGSYFSRVPKGLILDTVRDGAGARVATEITGLKKGRWQAQQRGTWRKRTGFRAC